VEDLAEQAILQLQAQKLVKTSGSFSQATRRQFIMTLGAIATPLVVSLPIAEQRAYAKQAQYRTLHTLHTLLNPPPSNVRGH